MIARALIPALALAGCAAQAPPVFVADNDPAVGGPCRDAGLDQFKGRTASVETGRELQRVSGARLIRWVLPGMAVTMDFSPERLTVQLDSANRIVRASCG